MYSRERNASRGGGSPWAIVITARPNTRTRGASHEGAATIYSNDLPGHEAGGGKVCDGIGDVVSRTRAMQRNAVDVLFIGRLAGKLNRPGRNAVHENFRRESTRQTAQSA